MSLIINNELNIKCRICLEIKSDMISFFAPIYHKDEDRRDSYGWYSLAEILQSISKVEVEVFNELPEQVCKTCMKRIVDFKDFLISFRKSQSRLREIVYNWSANQEDNLDSISKIEICNPTINEVVEEEGVCNEDEFCESNSVYDLKIDDFNSVPSENLSLRNEHNLPEVKKLDNCGNTIVCVKYSCEECGDCFLIKSGFSQHMMQKHHRCIQLDEFIHYSSKITITMPENYSENVLKFVPKSQQIQKMNKFQCQICKNVFSSDTEFKLHKEVHRTHKCPQCGAAFIKNSYLKDHLLMHSSAKMFGCEVCGKTFKYRNGLSVHKTIHENFRGHICDTCGKGFNARSTLYTHIRLKHHGEKKFPCPDCSLSFKEKSWLNKHILRKHSGNRTKDFVCSVCGIAYLNKYTLDRHVSDKHTGTAKRYYCTICDKSYTMKNKLNAHLEKKHFLAVDNDKHSTVEQVVN